MEYEGGCHKDKTEYSYTDREKERDAPRLQRTSCTCLKPIYTENSQKRPDDFGYISLIKSIFLENI